MLVPGVCCRPQALMLLCEYVLNSTRAPPSEALLFHTLLQLYLAEDLPEEQDEQSMAATSETTRRCLPHPSASPASSGLGERLQLLQLSPARWSVRKHLAGLGRAAAAWQSFISRHLSPWWGLVMR